MSNRSRPIVVTLLFLSGFTGLVYEFCWSKRLANLLGNTGQAHAIVLATFMGGLACGAWLFGRTADRSKRPLVVYACLELGVGVYALLFPWVLDGLGSVYLAIAPGLEGVPRTTARLMLAAAALVVPTLLMGGTLPAMTRHMTEGLGTARRELSILYAVNSLGASAGCLLAGVLFVPVQGITASERMAAMLNLLLGAAAVVAGWRAVLGPVSPAPEGVAAPKRYGTLAVRAALVGTAVAGFTSMLYEITWIRVISVVLGGTSYAFTLILTSFILGISLGSFWLSTRPDTDALKTFARLQLALVAAVCAVLPFYARLPYIFLQLNSQLEHAPQSWFTYQLLSFAFCGAVLLAPTFLLGASFPAAARVAMGSVENVGRDLGRVYLFNTVGTVLGSLLGGLLLLPTIGLEGNFIVGLLFNLTGAGVALYATREQRPLTRALAPVAVGLAVVVVWSLGTAGWAKSVAGSGRYREWGRSFDSYAQFRALLPSHGDVTFYKDDVFASVLVAEQAGHHRYLRINGKVDASNGRDVDTQVLAAHLGILTHPGEVKKVLVVGIGAGITVGSLLTQPVERVDVVEISPAVLEAAEQFKPDHYDAFSDPRCHVYLEDARTFLTLTREKYDLIVSVPSNPWATGVSSLFSQDFFRVAREKLAPQGRLVQWIHTYESNADLVQLVIRTLRDSFEHGTTWVGTVDLVMVASREPQEIDPEKIAQRMQREKVKKDLERLHLHEVTSLLARQTHGDEFQKRLGGTGPVNTDDHNILEYGSPVAYFVASTYNLPDGRNAPGGADELAITRYLKDHPLTAAQAKDLYEHFAWVYQAADPLVRSAAEAWYAVEPDSVPATLALARSCAAMGNGATAMRLLAPMIEQGERDPALVTEWLKTRRTQLRRERGPWHPVDVDAAIALGREVKAAHPGDKKLADALEELEKLR